MSSQVTAHQHLPKAPSLCKMTSGWSTLNGEKKNLCTAAANQHHNRLMIGCSRCDSSQIMYACAECYSGICHEMKNQTNNKSYYLDSQWLQSAEGSVINCFLETDWETLAKVPAYTEPQLDPESQKHLEIVTEAVCKNQTYYSLQWKGCCPCCYNIVFPPVEPVPFASEFARKKTTVEKTVEIISYSIGEGEASRRAKVVTHFVEAVISKEQAMAFSHRYADELEHVNYFYCMVAKEDLEGKGKEFDELWHLVCTKGPGSTALCFTKVGALKEFKEKTSKSGIPPEQFSLALASLHIDSSASGGAVSSAPDNSKVNTEAQPKRTGKKQTGKKQTGKKRTGKKRTVKKRKGNIRNYALRYDRPSGAFGNANGISLESERALICSTVGQGALPRNKPGASIIVALQKPCGIVHGFRTFYIGATIGNTTSKATSNPKTACPSHSAVASGKALVHKLQEAHEKKDPPGKEDQHKVYECIKESLEIFAFTAIEGAHLLHELNKRHSERPTSTHASLKAMAEFHSRKACYSRNGWSDASDSYHKLFISKNKKKMNFELALAAAGEYTLAFDAVGAHQDEVELASLENKMCLPLGVPDHNLDLNLPTTSCYDRVIPGFLAFPQYKVCVNCWALDDIQLHDLKEEVHFSSRLGAFCGAGLSDNRRGVWARNKNGKAMFYPDGAALLDWKK